MCLRHLSVSKLPEGVLSDPSEDMSMSWLLDSFEQGHTTDWDYVLRKLWKNPSACSLTTNGGQRLWLRGVYGKGSFAALPQGSQRRIVDDTNIQRKISDMRTHLEKDPIHSVSEDFVRRERVVKLINTETVQGTAFPIPGDIRKNNDFNMCPEAVMEDVVRMWSIVGGNLPGIGLTMPTFSDGWVDYEPWKVGPAFSRGIKKVSLNRFDPKHNNYTGFAYEPRVFLALNREWDQDTQISTCTTCMGHARRQHELDRRDRLTFFDR